MQTLAMLRTIGVAMGLLCVGACGERAADTSVNAATQVTAAAAKKERAAAAAEKTKGMATAGTSNGKPGAPVDLKFEFGEDPAAGQALSIDIALLPRMDSEFVRATFIATDGLAIAPAPLAAEFQSVVADEVYRYSLTVTPSEEGEYYLSAIVLMNLENGPQVRTFNIPVLVGEAARARVAARKKSAPPTDATGQAIESMPAAPEKDRQKD